LVADSVATALLTEASEQQMMDLDSGATGQGHKLEEALMVAKGVVWLDVRTANALHHRMK